MRKILLTLFYTLLAAGFVLVLLLWVIVLRENVKHDEPVRIYLPTGSDFRALTDTLERADLLRSRESFIITSRLKSFGKTVKPGSYVIEPGMSNNSLVNMLRSGRQTPVNVTFNNIRTLEELAGKTGGQIEAAPDGPRFRCRADGLENDRWEGRHPGAVHRNHEPGGWLDEESVPITDCHVSTSR